jgi:hypothetical protein
MLFVVLWHSSSKPAKSLNQQCWCQTCKFNRAARMLRHRKLTKVLCGWIAATIFVIVAVVAPGCSTQQNQRTPEEQSQNLPPVGSLDDYLAQGSNNYPYRYASYGPYDPFMSDPFWLAPYWYPVPVYYFPSERHRHDPRISATGGIPPLARQMHTTVESAAPSALVGSPHFGRFGSVGSGMRGFGAGHMGGGRR